MSNATVDQVLAPWADAPEVPFPALSHALNDQGIPLSEEMRRDMIAQGLINPVNQPGPGRPAMITAEDARSVVAAALIAVAVGVAIIAILRALSGSGGQLGPSGLILPIPAPPIPGGMT